MLYLLILTIFYMEAVTLHHLRGDETGIELGDEMRRLAAAAEKAFGINIDWKDADLSLGNRTQTENGVVRDVAAAIREGGFGIKDATISLEPDDERQGIKGSPNGLLRKGIQGPGSLGTMLDRRSQPLPHLVPAIPGKGYENFSTVVARSGDGGFYGANIYYTNGDDSTAANRNDLEQVVKVTESTRRGQHRLAAMYAFLEAGRIPATVVGGPKYTINDGDNSFQREIRRARDVFSGKPVEELTGKGILYKGEDMSDYRREIQEERKRLGIEEAISEQALVQYNEMLIDALYSWLVQRGPGSLQSNIVLPTLNRDGDCLTDLVGPIYSSVAGMTSEIIALDDRYKPTSVITEAPHGTSPKMQGQNKANPLAMFLALACVYNRIAEMKGKEYAILGQAASEIQRACMSVLGEGFMTYDLAGKFDTSSGEHPKQLGTREFTDAVISALGM